MKLRALLCVFALLTAAPMFAHADETDELDPFAPGVEDLLNRFDKVYEEETGLSSHINTPADEESLKANSCFRENCPVFIYVNKRSQSLALYIDGNYRSQWAISSGGPGHETPNFDRHPDGRIYDRYTSTKFPEGDYRGLGNMPYAVFIQDGFALHGTPEGNWRRLGHPASHGCIRQHPDNAYRLNRLVRSVGVRNVWITVQ